MKRIRILVIKFTFFISVSSIFPTIVYPIDHLPATHTESSGENTEMQGAYSLRWSGDWSIVTRPKCLLFINRLELIKS